MLLNKVVLKKTKTKKRMPLYMDCATWISVSVITHTNVCQRNRSSINERTEDTLFVHWHTFKPGKKTQVQGT